MEEEALTLSPTIINTFVEPYFSTRISVREIETKIYLYKIYLLKNGVSRDQETISCLCSCQLFRAWNEAGSMAFLSIWYFISEGSPRNSAQGNEYIIIHLKLQHCLEELNFLSWLLLCEKEKNTPITATGSWQQAEGNKFRGYLASASE